MENIKILVVGDSGSIHTARFVNLLQELKYDVRIFQSEFTSDLDEHLHNTIIYVYFPYSAPINNNSLKSFYPFELDSKIILKHKNLVVVLQIVKDTLRRYGKQPRVNELIKVLKKWKPEIILSLKMQNDGYNVTRAKLFLGNKLKAKWIHFCWGTDIEFFGKNKFYQKEHLYRIKKLLGYCDFFIADNQRDVKQVKNYGFSGINLGFMLANGGFNISEISTIRKKNSQKQDIIIIKGRLGDYVSKAENIILALQKIPKLIKNYKIKIILATPEMKQIINFSKKISGMDYEILPRLPYKKLLEIFAQSKISISATTVEGTPSFLLESMALGAFPIHSDIDSVREWIENGKNGLLFPVDNTESLISCIKKALSDDKLINQARTINWKICQERMDRNKIKKQIKNIVEDIILNNY